MYFCICEFFEYVKKPEIAGAVIGAVVGATISVAGFLLITQRQNKLQSKNQFEATFLNLLSILRQIVNNTKGTVFLRKGSEVAVLPSVNDGEKEGPAFFTEAADRLKFNMQINLSNPDNIFQMAKFKDDLNGTIAFLKIQAATEFNAFYDQHSSQLGHYFRFVYNIIKHVNAAPLSEKDKHFYVNLIQAQMSSDELALLFYNGIGAHGANFFELLKTYNDFLQNIDTKKIFQPNFHLMFYPEHKFDHIPENQAASNQKTNK